MSDSEQIQTTLNLLRDHGATVLLDTWGKNRVRYRERDDCYLRHGREMEGPNDYTTCAEEHVVDAIRQYGVRKVLG